MQFEPNNIYHIYNRGNNSQRIFFIRDNYLFFLKKLQTYITPFADILAWCLMPNHFHLMVYVNQITVSVNSPGSSKQVSVSHQLTGHGSSEQVSYSHQLTKLTKERSINDSISILLRSYTRAINNQESRTGSLFQHRTKAICISDTSGVTPAWFQTNYGTIINVDDPDKAYPQSCFNYIHMNPVNAGLSNNPINWEFSSFPDYFGIRNGKLINRERANEFGLHI
ncbi:hypothetical protein [uncultured Draconibacterium sp.]|uniref:hypothetical protein n=1 Tax=uncultured Draconibacterium sp. TaxID=1573823 RepID=UPI0032170A4D